MKRKGYYFEKLRSLENECVADVREMVSNTPFGEFVLDTPLTVGYDNFVKKKKLYIAHAGMHKDERGTLLTVGCNQGERGTLLKVSVGYGNLIGFIHDESGFESWNGNIEWGEFNCIFKVFDQIVAKQK